MGSTPDFRYPVSASSMIDSHSDQYSSSLVLRRPQKGRAAALRDEPSKVRPGNSVNSIREVYCSIVGSTAAFISARFRC